MKKFSLEKPFLFRSVDFSLGDHYSTRDNSTTWKWANGKYCQQLFWMHTSTFIKHFKWL